jgi:hypothetical protein
MGHPKAIAAIALTGLVALGCASISGRVERFLRPPGEKLEALPERVAEEYRCNRTATPFFKLERNEVVPERVAAGSSVNHRIVYALCSAHPTDVVKGALETRIVHDGATLAHDRDPAYELRPGRWIVDSTVEIPAAAQAGLYAIEVEFESRSVRFHDERSFAVVR